jgi:hypothetical protein
MNRYVRAAGYCLLLAVTLVLIVFAVGAAGRAAGPFELLLLLVVFVAGCATIVAKTEDKSPSSP